MNKQKILIFIVNIVFLYSYSQESINFDEHIESIEKETFISPLLKGEKNANKKSVEYALNYLKENGIQEKYITHRKLLQKIDLKAYKDSSSIQFYKKLSPKTEIEVNIKLKKFKISNHKISKRGKITQYIDGEIPHGAYYQSIPKIEIASIEIFRNGKKITIPLSAYSNYYNIFLKNFAGFDWFPEVYASDDGEYIFIYLHGGKAAGCYFTKLIFDREKYITEITAEYKELREWGAFVNRDFIGF